MAITTGMRRGELLALHWADVDLDGGYVQVRFTLQHTSGESYYFAQPKTKSSKRKVALTGVAIEALRRHRQRQQEQAEMLGEAWRDEDLVFTNPIGEAMRGNYLLQRHFAPLLKRAGLPAIRFHDLRHTAATLMLRQRIHPKVVSEMLGHSQIGITLGAYSHVLPDMQQEAVQALDKLLGE